MRTKSLFILVKACGLGLLLSGCVSAVKYKSLDLIEPAEEVQIVETRVEPAIIEAPVVHSTVSTTYVTPVPQSELFIVRGTNFEQDSAVLLPQGRRQLDEVANAVLNAGGTYSVVGYASTEGEDAYNLSLSERRARAVVSYLVRRGVPQISLYATGAGETTQFGSDLSSNRRVQITQLSSGSSSSSGTIISSTPILGATPVFVNQ